MKITNKKDRIFIILLIFMLVIGISGCRLIPKEKEELTPPLTKPDKRDYEVEKVRKASITKYIRGNGKIISAQRKKLYFTESEARLREIPVSEGDYVQQGEVVAKLDVRSLKNEIARQKLSLRRANLKVRQQKNSREEELEAIKLAKANLKLDNLQQEYNRLQKLGSAVTEVKKQQVKYKLDQQKQQVKAAKLKLETKNNFGVEQAQLEAAKAKLKLKDLKRQLSESILQAPFYGRVTFIDDLEAGDRVEAYETVIEISDPQQLRVMFASEEADKVVSGMAAKVEYNDQFYAGEVAFATNIQREDDWRTKSYVIVDITSQQLREKVKIGDLVDVRVVLASREDTLVIPRQALRTFNDRDYVEVLSDGKRKEVTVKIGIKSETKVEILSGLEVGQKVILD